MTSFTTLGDGSLHGALKARPAGAMPGALVGAEVFGFVVDVVGAGELAEIQTGRFASAKRKLERLLDAHRIVLLHPIAVETWIVRVDDGSGRPAGPFR